jgi:hypothetical protein
MPYPNTPLYTRLEREGRHLYDGQWWLHPRYRFNDAAFVPARMTGRPAHAGLLRGAHGVQPHPVAPLALLRPQDQHANAHAHGHLLALQTPCSGAKSTRSTGCSSGTSAIADDAAPARGVPYVAPAVLTPLAALAVVAPLPRTRRPGGDRPPGCRSFTPTWFPGVGTNVLKVWEFDTRLRLGRFRPHHGFVFGSATAMLALLTVPAPDPASRARRRPASRSRHGRGAPASPTGPTTWPRHPRRHAQGLQPALGGTAGRRSRSSATTRRGSSGGFGFLYGAGLALAESLQGRASDPVRALGVGALLLAATVTLPTLGYVAQSYARHGHHGCRPIPRGIGA